MIVMMIILFQHKLMLQCLCGQLNSIENNINGMFKWIK